MTDDKLAAALVGKLAVKLQSGEDVYKIVREIENRSKRNPTFSSFLVRKGVIIPLLQILRRQDSRLELKQRCLGTFVNITSKLPESKHACLQAGVLDYLLEELVNTEGDDPVCRKWLLATIVNLLTIPEAKTSFIDRNGIVSLVNVVKTETETLPVRGLGAMALGNIIKDSNETANVAFTEGVCDAALELLQQDQIDCQNSSAFILDIIIWKVPKAPKDYISSGAVPLFARSLRDEVLSLKASMHLVSCFVKLIYSEKYVLHELRNMKILDSLSKLTKEDPELLRTMDPLHNLQLLIGALKFSTNGVLSRNVTEGDQYSQSQYSESVVERRSTDTTESMDRLRKLSESLSTPEELEALIKAIYESCKEDDLAAEDMIDKGAIAQLLKLINSHSRNVRKFAAATLAVLTNGYQKGCDCFHDNGGCTLLLQTIPNEEDNVVRRLLVNALSNCLAHGMIIEQFVSENGLPLYIGIMQKDTDAIARSWAAIGIGNVANYSSKYCEELVMAGACELSIELITHQHPRCKSAAVRTLGVLLTKCPNLGVQKTVETPNGLRTLIDAILAEKVAVETKLAASWCLGEIAEVDLDAVSVANENLEELQLALPLLKQAQYSRNDKKFLHQKLDRLFEVISTNVQSGN